MVFQVFGVAQAEIMPKHAKPSIPPSHEFASAISSRTPCRILGGANIVRMAEARRCMLFRANSERLSGRIIRVGSIRVLGSNGSSYGTRSITAPLLPNTL